LGPRRCSRLANQINQPTGFSFAPRGRKCGGGGGGGGGSKPIQLSDGIDTVCALPEERGATSRLGPRSSSRQSTCESDPPTAPPIVGRPSSSSSPSSSWPSPWPPLPDSSNQRPPSPAATPSAPESRRQRGATKSRPLPCLGSVWPAEGEQAAACFILMTCLRNGPALFQADSCTSSPGRPNFRPATSAPGGRIGGRARPG